MVPSISYAFLRPAFWNKMTPSHSQVGHIWHWDGWANLGTSSESYFFDIQSIEFYQFWPFLTLLADFEALFTHILDIIGQNPFVSYTPNM